MKLQFPPLRVIPRRNNLPYLSNGESKWMKTVDSRRSTRDGNDVTTILPVGNARRFHLWVYPERQRSWRDGRARATTSRPWCHSQLRRTGYMRQESPNPTNLQQNAVKTLSAENKGKKKRKKTLHLTSIDLNLEYPTHILCVWKKYLSTVNTYTACKWLFWLWKRH